MSKYFKNFSTTYHLMHATSSSRHSLENGLPEKTVGTAKALFKKALNVGEDYTMYCYNIDLQNMKPL